MLLRQKILILSLMAVFPLISSCFFGGSDNVKEIDTNDPTISIIYGYIDMDDAPTELEWLNFTQYKPPTVTPHYPCRVADGLFYHVGIRPGSLQVSSFGASKVSSFGGSLRRTIYTYGFNSGKNETAIEISKPGVYFLGAYKYVEQEDEDTGKQGYILEPLKKPSQKELLKKVLEDYKDENGDDKKTIAKIQAALAKLK